MIRLPVGLQTRQRDLCFRVPSDVATKSVEPLRSVFRSNWMMFGICVCSMFLALESQPALAAAEPLSATNRVAAVDALKSRGVDVSVERLIQFAGQGDWTTVELLLSAGVAVTAVDSSRQVTALHNAAAQGHSRIVRELIARGANVNAEDWMGATPLVNAAYFGRLNIMPMLIDAGAEFGMVSPRSVTPLNAAVEGGVADSISLLITAGADPDLKSAGGVSARELAHSLKRADLLKLMSGTHMQEEPLP